MIGFESYLRRATGFGGKLAARQFCEIFDSDYYLRENAELLAQGVDPLRHYVEIGWAEGRNPCPLFHSGWYLERNADVAELGSNPLAHYMAVGWREGRAPHPLFDGEWYLRRHLDVKRAGLNPLHHYCTVGWKERRAPMPLFDSREYALRAGLGDDVEPLSHYIEHGFSSRISPHPLFASDWYLATNPDVAGARENPLVHYFARGWRENRQPHPLFDGAFYLQANPDVAACGENPLVHYVTVGWREGRNPNSYFDLAYYRAYLGKNDDGTDPLTHYMTKGWLEGRSPSAKFDSNYYLLSNPDVRASGAVPLAHYMQSGLAEGRKPLKPALIGAHETYGEYSAEHRGPAILLKETGAHVSLRFSGSIAVHLHLFHREMLAAFVRALQSLPHPFDLYVSTHGCEDRDVILDELSKVEFAASVVVEEMPNRGRDIAPMIVGFGDRLKDYDIIFHLHTKRSDHTPLKRDWGVQLRHHLLHSRAHATRVLNMFADDQTLGMVFPVYHPSVAEQIKWGSNFECASTLMAELGVDIVESDLSAFPAGSFFVARSQAIKAVFDLAMPLERFQAEAAQMDGTLSHAIERIWPLIAKRQGFRSLQIRAEKPHSLGSSYLRGDPYFSPLLDQSRNGGRQPPRSFAPRLAAGLQIDFYSCATDGYDAPLPFEAVVDGASHTFYANHDVPSQLAQWSVRPLAFDTSNRVKVARFHKAQPHVLMPNADIAIWIDGNISIVGDVAQLIDNTLMADADFGVIPHPYRKTYLEEGDKLISLGLEDAQVIQRQTDRYLAEGYRGENGLTETNFIVMDLRRPKVRQALDIWRRELELGSKRDQLSFDYALWKAGAVKHSLFEDGLSVRGHHAFAYFRHGAHAEKASPDLSAEALPLSAAPVDVVVCIHNSPDDTARCLRSLETTRDNRTRIIIVDDGSGETTKEVIARHIRRNPGDVLVRHESARGYTVAANAGMRASTGEFVVLLNSDTIVPRGWVDALTGAAMEHPDIGIIGPLSNAASWQSVPEAQAADGDFIVNALGPWETVDSAAAACASLGAPDIIRVPVVNGFCFMIKRKVIDAIGFFDEVAFPQGYGEENDFCLRAGEVGFSCAVAPATYVFHSKSKSFSHARRLTLSDFGWKMLVEKHGQEKLSATVQSLKGNPALARVRAAFKNRVIDRKQDVLPIAFYLPQFHPFKFNDEAWGPGFTEWRNVVKARPRYEGHFQPRLPGALGFYDLRLSQTLADQAALAAACGLFGFCVYYYRFGARRLMSAPTDVLRENADIPFRYYYCWANEDWTRAWDGRTDHVLLKQTYDGETLANIVGDLANAVDDTRYIRIDDKPIFGIYQLDRLPDARAFVGALRSLVRDKIGCDLVVAATYNDNYTPEWSYIADIIVQFPPHRMPRSSPRELLPREAVSGADAEAADFFESYDAVVRQSLAGVSLVPRMHPGVCPDWDNSPRRAKNANILVGSTPEKFADWTRAAAEVVLAKFKAGEICAPVLYINAWNEWAEGAFLEPTEKYGDRCLSALRAALSIETGVFGGAGDGPEVIAALAAPPAPARRATAEGNQ